MTGFWIAFEGIDGSGKSTQCVHLSEALMQEKHDVVLTREPGGTTGGIAIRQLLVQGDTNRWDPQTEALLFAAAQRDHLLRVVHPACREGKIVISDRSLFSTLAYQGAGHQLGFHEISNLQEIAFSNLDGPKMPDLVVLIDLPVEIAAERAKARGGNDTRFERKGLPFMERVRQGFLHLARIQFDRFLTFDGTKSPDILSTAIRSAVSTRIKN